VTKQQQKERAPKTKKQKTTNPTMMSRQKPPDFSPVRFFTIQTKSFQTPLSGLFRLGIFFSSVAVPDRAQTIRHKKQQQQQQININNII
jgi:hypothetical protein